MDRHATLLAMLILLPGCLGTGADGEDPLPLLESFRECNYTYPDGSPVDCEGTRAAPMNVGRPNHFCQARTSEDRRTPYLEIQWDFLTDEYFVVVVDPEELTTLGAIVLRSDDGREELFAWKTPPGGVGWISVGKWPDGGLHDEDAFIAFMPQFNISAEADAGEAVYDARWTIFEGEPWLVHDLQVAGQDHWFMETTRLNVITGNRQIVLWGSLADVSIRGQDFSVNVDLISPWGTGYGPFPDDGPVC